MSHAWWRDCDYELFARVVGIVREWLRGDGGFVALKEILDRIELEAT